MALNQQHTGESTQGLMGFSWENSLGPETGERGEVMIMGRTVFDFATPDCSLAHRNCP